MYNIYTSRYSVVIDGDVRVDKHFIVKHEESEALKE